MPEKREINNETPGSRVRWIRKQLKLTQEQFAERLEIKAPNYISMLETGVRELPVDLAQKIASLLPPTRFEWVMGFDSFRTENDRIASIINGRHEIGDLIQRLMILHGYMIQSEEIMLDKNSLSVRYYLIGPDGTRKYFTDAKEITALFNEISDFVRFKCWNFMQPIFSDYLHTRKQVD